MKLARHRPPCGGFTLIEMLVVLVLLGVFAGLAVPTLPDAGLAARRDSVRAWQRQAETAALRAATEARAWGWSVEADAARLLVAGPAGWRPAEAEPQQLAAGLRLERAEIDGRPLRPGEAIRFTDLPPLFAVWLSDGERRWRIAGLPSGLIRSEENP